VAAEKNSCQKQVSFRQWTKVSVGGADFRRFLNLALEPAAGFWDIRM
jgi:hypothetical protein